MDEFSKKIRSYTYAAVLLQFMWAAASVFIYMRYATGKGIGDWPGLSGLSGVVWLHLINGRYWLFEGIWLTLAERAFYAIGLVMSSKLVLILSLGSIFTVLLFASALWNQQGPEELPVYVAISVLVYTIAYVFIHIRLVYFFIVKKKIYAQPTAG